MRHGRRSTVFTVAAWMTGSLAVLAAVACSGRLGNDSVGQSQQAVNCLVSPKSQECVWCNGDSYCATCLASLQCLSNFCSKNSKHPACAGFNMKPSSSGSGSGSSSKGSSGSGSGGKSSGGKNNGGDGSGGDDGGDGAGGDDQGQCDGCTGDDDDDTNDPGNRGDRGDQGDQGDQGDRGDQGGSGDDDDDSGG